MSSDADPTADEDSSPVPDCPSCGEPVAVVSVTGPHTAAAGPCGCSITPGLLERD